jgi:pimeloyl-ACP methyl ester carboxylesterase
MTVTSSRPIGSAVLVHGGWGNPEDWQWVAKILRQAGVEVATPDLPSHRSPTAGVAEDVAEVRQAIRDLRPPVVLVGWSYGGVVITRTAAEEPSLRHLVYLATIPETGAPDSEFANVVAFFEQDPHIDVRPDGTCVLDNDWWLNEEAGATFPEEVRAVLAEHPRRPSSLKTLQPPPTTPAWETIPSTVLLGRQDSLMSDEERQGAKSLRADVRVLDTDHFIPFRQPEIIAQTILEALATA